MLNVPVPRVDHYPRILFGVRVQREIGKYLQVALVIVERYEVGGIDVSGYRLETLEDHVLFTPPRAARPQPRRQVLRHLLLRQSFPECLRDAIPIGHEEEL